MAYGICLLAPIDGQLEGKQRKNVGEFCVSSVLMQGICAIWKNTIRIGHIHHDHRQIHLASITCIATRDVFDGITLVDGAISIWA